MIVPFKSVGIETITGPDRAEACLAHLAEFDAPGYALRYDGRHVGMDVIDQLAQIVKSRGGVLGRGALTFGDTEVGWHIDGNPDDDDNLPFVAWRGETGVARAQIILPKLGFWALGPTYAELPEAFTGPLADGKIDDTLAEVQVHTTELGPEDVFVFATGGPKPAVHNFTNVTEPRLSHSHPGLLIRSRHART